MFLEVCLALKVTLLNTGFQVSDLLLQLLTKLLSVPLGLTKGKAGSLPPHPWYLARPDAAACD